MAKRTPAPRLDIERRHWENGAETVVGVDEVGRGAWAGNLTIGAVVLPRDRRVNGVRDSKMLSEATREKLFDRVANWCEAWAVGHASPAECDELGMSAAQKLATRRALRALDRRIDVALVDGPWDFVDGGPDGSTRSETIVKGDRHSLSIAAASIIAKVTRDRLMRAAAEHYPHYHFDTNKGYPCPRHQVALHGYGASAIHRRSWAFMDSLSWTAQHRPVPTPPAVQGSLALFEAAPRDPSGVL